MSQKHRDERIIIIMLLREEEEGKRVKEKKNIREHETSFGFVVAMHWSSEKSELVSVEQQMISMFSKTVQLSSPQFPK